MSTTTQSIEWEQDLRERMGIEIPPGGKRPEWTRIDSMNVVRLRKRGLTIRTISDVLRCSTRTVQDVLQGKRW